MKKESSSKCPNCGFDFGKIKPQLDYYTCACKKYCAEFTSEGITILSMSRDYACGYYSGVDITEEVFSKLALKSRPLK
jgi:hypothetical protein